MQRRQFLEQAGVLTASSLAGLAAAPYPIKVGMLGTQHSHTTGKLKAMRASADYEVVAACENDAAAKAQAQKDPGFEGVRWLNEDELIHDPSIQLIVVECWIWEAIPWGKKVIAAGKHLHLEKPPGNKWEPFKELVEEARRKKLLLQTGYLWRFHAGLVSAIEAAQKGWLGDIYLVRASMDSDRGGVEREREARFKGGGLFELGGHVIDRTVELLGRPNKVQTWLRHDTGVADKLADNNLAVFEFGKALAIITQAAKSPGSAEHRYFEIVGSDGSIMVFPETNPPRLRVHLRKAQGPFKAGTQEVTLPPQPRFVADFQELARALKSGQPLKHSYEHELLLQETLLRASGELV